MIKHRFIFLKVLLLCKYFNIHWLITPTNTSLVYMASLWRQTASVLHRSSVYVSASISTNVRNISMLGTMEFSKSLKHLPRILLDDVQRLSNKISLTTLVQNREILWRGPVWWWKWVFFSSLTVDAWTMLAEIRKRLAFCLTVFRSDFVIMLP